MGGDTCAADHLVIDVFLAGFAPYGAVTRGGAKVGDDIYVTGTLGDSALGLALLSEPRLKVSARDRNYLIRQAPSPHGAGPDRHAAGQVRAWHGP